MTPAEQEQISINGGSCYVNVVFIMVFTIASGIATLGILIAIWLLHVKTWREPKAVQLVCWQTFLFPFFVFGQIRFDIKPERGVPVPPSLDIINNIVAVLSEVELLAGDLVICWRAWVLLPRDIFWRFVLAVLIICDIGFDIADLVFDTEIVTLPVLDLATVVTPLAVNIAATSLIGWKAW
ncbi:hypothetical protein BDP27DRAFT_1361897 [Rhodocollybia butyracea]|uniref:Uncharacterized protein n=1 Tax=Rhodocollybia butyracea TaxID=206335 RepID=A0A9P5PYB2_9AGAR|nr:hypothetical protein BDP27DRAFT_1361897 [Rhodocollybia butyracea]